MPVTTVNLEEKQVSRLKQTSETIDQSVSKIVRNAVDSKLSEIDWKISQQATMRIEKEKEIEAAKHDFIKRSLALIKFPDSFDFPYIIDTQIFDFEPFDIANGKYSWRALCADCRSKENGYYHDNVKQMAERITAAFDPNLIFEGETLQEAYNARFKLNELFSRPHGPHKRMRPNKDIRGGLLPVNTVFRVEVILKKDIREQIEADYIQTWRAIKKMKGELARLEPSQILGGDFDAIAEVRY